MDELEDFFDNGALEDERSRSPEGEEAVEAPGFDPVADVFKKKKSAVLKPRFNLNEMVLTSSRGIPALRDLLKDYTPDAKANPYSNLKVMMKKYEHWAHLMYPSSKFEDVISRCETLGRKRRVKVYMSKTRLDIPVTDEDFEENTRSKTYDVDELIDDGQEEEDEFAYQPNTFRKDNVEKEAGRQRERSPIENAAGTEVEEEAMEAELRAMEEERRREEERLANEEDELMQDLDINDW